MEGIYGFLILRPEKTVIYSKEAADNVYMHSPPTLIPPKNWPKSESLNIPDLIRLKIIRHTESETSTRAAWLSNVQVEVLGPDNRARPVRRIFVVYDVTKREAISCVERGHSLYRSGCLNMEYMLGFTTAPHLPLSFPDEFPRMRFPIHRACYFSNYPFLAISEGGRDLNLFNSSELLSCSNCSP